MTIDILIELPDKERLEIRDATHVPHVGDCITVSGRYFEVEAVIWPLYKEGVFAGDIRKIESVILKVNSMS